MSHYSVVVCLDDPACLDDLLAPYDENKEVEPYRSYEDGGPAEFWLYSLLQRADEDDRNGTGIKPYKPDEIGYSSASSKEPPEVQRKKIADDAALFRSLPVPITWRDIVRTYNEKYGDEDSELLYDEATDRAYTMSTYNPDSKWDYWRIGGRWGGYFRYRDGCRDHVIKPERGWDSPEVIAPDTCNGGPKSALDLDRMREDKADDARRDYAKFHDLVEGTPEALPFRVFADNISPESGYGIDRARKEYRSQPRVERIKGSEFNYFGSDAIEDLQQPERVYVDKQRAGAVPGYALLTLDGKWMAPGRMGWFGMSSESESDLIGYWEVANAYLDSVPESTWLVVVDCHI
jgi:hypothetical protein